MPNQPKTPHRTMRIPDELWDPAMAKARTQGETVTDVVKRALEDYLKEN